MVTDNSFFVLKPNPLDIDFATVEKCNSINPEECPVDIKNGELLLCNDLENIIDYDCMYKYKTLVLPYEFRDRLLKANRKDSLINVSKKLFELYLNIVQELNDILFEVFPEVQIYCCMYCYDFCLLSSDKECDLILVSKILVKYLKEHLSLDSSEDDRDRIYSEFNIIRNQEQIMDCLLSGRQFVKYNPMASYYIAINKDLNSIKCDSIEQKEELSLLSSLVVKDLIEETHLYWMYESGEVRYENATKNYILTKRNRQYFEYFRLFCEQASFGNVFHDWLWSLVFLTQTLLASFVNRSINQNHNNNHSNFFGFVPVFEDLKNERSELTSHFSRHISKKFCHGFLVVPVISIQKLPEYFPDYIHEFFHYIPPTYRKERNKAILKLVLHSALCDYRIMLPKDVYDEILYIVERKIKLTFSKFNLNNDAVFSCDSMEYMERLRVIFNKINSKELFKEISCNISKIFDGEHDLIVNDISSKICEVFSGSARDYTNTFVLFFREIRSDISMCLLLDIGIEKYIEILADEPLFAALNGYDSADSTILRFGFMCRFLYKLKKNEIDESNLCKIDVEDETEAVDETKVWLQDCCEIINDRIQESISKGDFKLADKFKNLKSYLFEYVSLAIEQQDNQYTRKGSSLLESILYNEKLLKSWVDDIKRYAKHPFAIGIKSLYNDYTTSEDLEKLKTLFGMRILFRDLYSYNPNLDLS